jgi:hypothetical protein
VATGISASSSAGTMVTAISAQSVENRAVENEQHNSMNVITEDAQGDDLFDIENLVNLFDIENLVNLFDHSGDISTAISARNHKKDITLHELSNYFNMPLDQAAKELKVSATLLKKKCRDYDIPHWPHRQLKSLERLIENIKVPYMLLLIVLIIAR